MAQPTLKVEIAFVSDALDTAPTWVDVSSKVRSDPAVQITRGRPSERAQFSAGTCRLTLNNRDRRFDPSYSSGPYYGNLVPGKQIRVSAVYSATTYRMFTGWILGWPQGFKTAGKDAVVTIDCVDALGWLARARLSSDAVWDYANTTIGSLALFLRKVDSTYWLDETSNGYDATLYSGTGRTSSSLAQGLNSSAAAVSFDHSTMWRTADTWQSSGAWSVAFWMQTTDTTGATYPLGGGNDGGDITQVGVATDGTLTVELADIPAGTGVVFGSTVIVNDGVAHHVVITGDNATLAGLRVYVDAVDVTFSPVGGATSAPFLLDALGGPTIGASLDAMFNGAIQDIAAFDLQLTAGQVSTLFDLSRGYVEETAAERIDRVLDDVSWPATWRDISTTLRSSCGRLVLDGRKALEAVQEIEETEQGRIFAAKDNDLTFLSRYWVQEDTRGNTVQATFSDDGAGIKYTTFGYTYDDIDIENDITVKADPNSWARYVDLTSVGVVGARAGQVSTLLTSRADAAAMAAGLVYIRKDAQYRSDPIVVYPKAADWATIFGLELGDRVRAEITPMQVGSQQVFEMTTEQIGWSCGADGNWQFTLAGAPVPPDFFMLDSSALDGPDALGF